MAAAAPLTLSGLWHGEIIYSRAQVELEVVVEIGAAPDGELVGTIDVPSQHMKLYPLADAGIDGTAVSFGFIRDTEKRPEAHFTFVGTMSADGSEINGTFTGWYTDENNNQAPFYLRRIGEPGDQRPAERRGPLRELADDCREARQAFNDARDQVRLVMLLSPTCGVCLASARVVQKYVLDKVPDEDLAVLVIWGPMQGYETREHAEEAPAFVPDKRASHFWTTAHGCAELFAEPLGLEDEPAWDTFLLYPPEVQWQDQPQVEAPAPTRYMHVGRSLPKERRLQGETLAQEVEQMLTAAKASTKGR